ncbi:TRAP transporter small permease [Halovulum dunhuangense]|uniref:TRAP transporter small permease protein n=1 Tax=Halovulum dunhuangense TaxID=1505036 RepID=A0A849L6B6_9RHOB|nr:TRAP transporter small permease [Halovulum dunhuangense]NNU82058.1 TRAP transporter small permease [Halovulum dunhuangense]
MQNTHDNGRAPDPGRSTHPIARLWALAVDGLAALGTVMIGLLMLVICADVVARNVMGGSLPLVSELGALMLVMIVYLQLAATVRADRLARTDMFLPGFRRRFPRAGAALAAVFDLVGAVAIGGIAWATLGILGKDMAAGEYIGVTGVATLPSWPFRALILLGVAVAAIEFARRAVAGLGIAIGREGAR